MSLHTNMDVFLLFFLPGALLFFWIARLCSLQVAGSLVWYLGGGFLLIALLVLSFGSTSGMGAGLVVLSSGMAGCVCIIFGVLSYLLKAMRGKGRVSPRNRRVFTLCINSGGVCLLLTILTPLLLGSLLPDMVKISVTIIGITALVFHALAFIVYVWGIVAWLLSHGSRLGE